MVQGLRVASVESENASLNCLDKLEEVYFGPAILVYKRGNLQPNSILLTHAKYRVRIDEETLLCDYSMFTTFLRNLFFRIKKSKQSDWRLNVRQAETPVYPYKVSDLLPKDDELSMFSSYNTVENYLWFIISGGILLFLTIILCLLVRLRRK